jgi:glutathione S-transferase
MRARLALLASGTVCTLREVKLSAKPQELLAASPKGTVPVLVLPDSQVIEESLDIMRWALTQADPDHWLDGEEAALIAANDGPFKHHLDRYKYPHRHDADPLEHRAAGIAHLEVLEARLTASPYLCGQRWTMTDAALAPFVRQFAETDRAWFDAQPLPAVQRWLAAFLASPMFAAIMVRRTVWQAGDAEVVFG